MTRAWRWPVAALVLAGPLLAGPHVGDARPEADPGTKDSSRVEGPPSAPSPALQPRIEPAARSYTRAYVALGAGVALCAGSFFAARSADRAYDRYQVETDPDRIEDHFQDARHLDRVSTMTLLAGQGAIALGLYWRFLHKPRDGHAWLDPSGDRSASPSPSRALSLRPSLTRHHAGLALVVPLP